MKNKLPQKVYISGVKNLLITTKEKKDGIVFGDEISLYGVEEIQWQIGEEKHCIGMAVPVYGVVDKNNQILIEQLPFYFYKNFAISAARQMNGSIKKKQKPYKVKKGYLFYPHGRE